MPQVSVIMPSYNHARYIRMAVASVLRQTVQDIELIVIDDGSTDGTQEILRGIKDDRLRCVLRERNIGASQGSNEGITMARSPYFAMISSDDVFLPTKLEQQLNVLTVGDGVTAVFCVPRLIDEGGHVLPAGSHILHGQFVAGRWSRTEVLRRLFYGGNFFCHPSVMARREAYERVGPYDIRMSSLGDLDMWVRMAIGHAGDFVAIDGNLMEFRIHDGNASGPTVENVQCGLNEWPLIVGRFRELKHQHDVFLEAFPEASSWMRGSVLDVDFALAQLACQHHLRSIRAYGISRLYELMADDFAAGVLRDMHGFTARDLIRQSQATDTTGTSANPEPNTAMHHRAPLTSRIKRGLTRLPAKIQAKSGSLSRLLQRKRSEWGTCKTIRARPGYTKIHRAPMRVQEAAAVADSYLQGQQERGAARGIHLGCGDKKLEGWLNVDIGGMAEVVWDLTLPFHWTHDAAFDYCFSEHVLEHFPRHVGVAILREAHRILRVGGVLRISVPDLKNVVAMYCDENCLDVTAIAKDVIAPTAAEAVALFGDSYGSRGERLNVCMYGWGHAYLYDEEDLVRTLKQAGFSDISRQKHSQSDHAPLHKLETRSPLQSALIIEGIKT